MYFRTRGTGVSAAGEIRQHLSCTTIADTSTYTKVSVEVRSLSSHCTYVPVTAMWWAAYINERECSGWRDPKPPLRPWCPK